MSRFRNLPTGRLGRLTRLARVGARTGASLLMPGDGQGAAQQAAEVLGSLRGLAAKVGQMASYVDGVVPERHRDAYESALKGLRTAAPSSSPEAIRLQVEQELGAPIDQLFAEWDEQPMASASIGQVHRARLHDGREVAVKAQHPGIDRAVENDLKNASVLEHVVGMLGPRALNSKQVYEEIAERFREELDYGLEAERQAMFRELMADEPHIHIPAVIAERSSRRVLTTELCHGASFDDVTDADEPLRRHYCEVLWRFVYKGNLVGGVFNADPHPGNYLFQEDGTITFLDFGCVQPIPPDRLDKARALHRSAHRRDEETFRRVAVEILRTQGGGYEQAVQDYVRRCFDPLFERPFRITRDYVSEVVQGVYAMKEHVLPGGDHSFTPLPEGMVFMNRLQFGFYSVLARLDAEADYAGVEMKLFEDAGL
jgi:predicted unusual protein kinase regulating ubiquinone biosynthesis (AarF/ABC1/UbiB family)